MSLAAAEIIVTGRVHGVGFRYFCLTHANNLGLNGYVKNMPDGSVNSFVEGDKDSIEQYFNLMQQGPKSSSVTKTEINWFSYIKQFNSFMITS